MKKASELLEEARAQNPAIDNQFPTPYVVEAIDDIVNLSAPFTLLLPAITSPSYTDVLLVFVNADGSRVPQEVIHKQAISGAPTTGEVENDKLDPKFEGHENAVVECFLQVRQTGIWERTPDSVIYSF